MIASKNSTGSKADSVGFLEDSDVAKVNVIWDGEILFIAEETHACLLQALDYYAKTRGLFDITLGRVIEHRQSEAEGPPPAIEGSHIVHPDGEVLDIPEIAREITFLFIEDARGISQGNGER
jgi:hypothetical protein